MTLFEPEPSERTARVIAPGAIHVPNWLSLNEQRRIVNEFNYWIQGPVPMRAPMFRGHEMSVNTVCLGWHWRPNRYTRKAIDVNGARVLLVPAWMVDLGKRALGEAGHNDVDVSSYEPDAVLVNYYDENAHMGMHQDRDEVSLAPVVSISTSRAR